MRVFGEAEMFARHSNKRYNMRKDFMISARVRGEVKNPTGIKIKSLSPIKMAKAFNQ